MLNLQYSKLINSDKFAIRSSRRRKIPSSGKKHSRFNYKICLTFPTDRWEKESKTPSREYIVHPCFECDIICIKVYNIKFCSERIQLNIALSWLSWLATFGDRPSTKNFVYHTLGCCDFLFVIFCCVELGYQHLSIDFLPHSPLNPQSHNFCQLVIFVNVLIIGF